MVQEVPVQVSRFKSDTWQMLLGFVLIIISIFLIFWNEGIGLHGVKPMQVKGYLITPVPNTPVDFNNNDKLIYTTGVLTSNNVLQDPLLGYSEKAIKIERRVEMFQWTQTEESKREKLADGSEKEVVTYIYKPIWSKDLIDSNGFKDAVSHRNPVNMPINTLEGQAQDITVGDFHLAPELIALIPGEVPVNLSNANVSNIQRGTKLTVQHDGNFIFIGENPKSPVVGDVRISIYKVIPQDVSIIAQQSDNVLHPLKVEGSKPFAMLAIGQVPLNDMMHKSKTESKYINWLIRFITLFMLLIGVGLLVKLLATRDTPSIQRFLILGTVLTSFLIGLGIWTALTAIAWFIVTPFWAIILLIIVITIYSLIFAVLRRRGKLRPIE